MSERSRHLLIGMGLCAGIGVIAILGIAKTAKYEDRMSDCVRKHGHIYDLQAAELCLTKDGRVVE